MKASVLYKWLTYSAIAISILLCLFMLQAGLKGNFRSVDAFQAYIRGFGLFAPFVFVFIQAFRSRLFIIKEQIIKGAAMKI